VSDVSFSFSCGDVIPGCASRFHAETEAGLIDLVSAHAAAEHGLAEIPPEVVEQVRERIVSD
jgi:predicted small metal-binding protein